MFKGLYETTIGYKLSISITPYASVSVVASPLYALLGPLLTYKKQCILSF